MSAVSVIYTLSTGGDLQKDLPGLASGLDRVKANAMAAKDAVKDLGEQGRAGLNNVGEGAKTAAEGAGKALVAMAALGYGLHQLISTNEEYAQSTARLVTELGTLKKGIADAIGPTVASFVDNFTVGLVFLANLVGNTVGPAFSTLTSAVMGFVDAAATGLSVWGKIATGDFAGAMTAIQTQRQQLVGVLDTLKSGWAAIQEGQEAAWTAAFEAWKRQADGINDAVGKVDKATTQLTTATGPSVEQSRIDMMLGHSPSNARGIDTPATETSVSPEGEAVAEAVKASGAETASAIVGAIGGGLSGVMSAFAGGPVTAIVEGVLEILRDPSILTNLFMDVLDIYSNLDSMVEGILEEVIPGLIGRIPELVSAFATLGPSVAVALVDSAPELFSALIDALFELPGAFANAILHIFTGNDLFPETIGQFGRGGILETHIGQGRDSILGVKVPQLGGGGGDRGRSERNYSTSIGAIHIHGATNARDVAEQLQRETGPYGLGLSLTPHAS